MKEIQNLLKKQLVKNHLSIKELDETWQSFLQEVSQTYRDYEDSIKSTVSSQELIILQTTIDSYEDAIFISDSHGYITHINKKFWQLWNVIPKEKDLQDESTLLLWIQNQVKDSIFFSKQIQFLKNSPKQVLNHIYKLKNGNWLEKNSKPIIIDENFYGRLWSFRDVTDFKKVEEQLLYEAYHDSLTGLPNRSFFLIRLESLSQFYRIDPTKEFALMFIDLDRFKRINDELGNFLGDKLLIKITRRLKNIVSELGILSRLSGDEFIVLFEDLNTIPALEKIARDILAGFSKSFYIEHREVYLSASIGIVRSTQNFQKPEDLLKYADMATNHIKKRSRGSFGFFSETLLDFNQDRIEMEADLRNAIEAGQLELFFQPIFDIASRRVSGFESLVRWHHPEKGLIPPDKFISLAEETGLILPLGDWALRSAVETIYELHNANYPIYISVNVSALQFRQKKMLRLLKSLLRHYKISPTSLCLEITETSIMDNPIEANQLLCKIKELGLKISIDDFGTGYSSLSYLKQFPADLLKIDQSFIRDLPADKDNSQIVKAIIAMAHNLNLQVISEGIETIEQFQFLKENGCELIQGYLIDRPQKKEKIIDIIVENFQKY